MKQVKSCVGIVKKKLLFERLFKILKKRAVVLTISTWIIEAWKKAYTSSAAEKNLLFLLKCLPCIHHLVRFKKDQAKIQPLLDFGSKINVITLAYTAKLGLKVRSTHVGAQKIDDSTFKTFGMVQASF